MANLGSLIYQVGADTSKLKKSEQEVKSSAGRMDKTLAGVGKSFGSALALTGVGTGLSSVVAGLRSVIDAGMQMKRLDQAFTSITGSVSASRNEMEFLSKTADKLGSDFITVAEGYKTIAAAAKGTSLEGKGVRDIFMAIMKEGTRLSLTNEQVQGSLYAISQMISKGTVSAEELRQQLGERLPGAFQKAARAMGVTTQQLSKMVEEGRVLAEEFIPKLAAELDKVKDEAVNVEAPFNRVTNAWRELRSEASKTIVGKITISGIEKVGEGLQFYADWLKRFNAEKEKAAEKPGTEDKSTLWKMKETNRLLEEAGFFDTQDLDKLRTIFREVQEHVENAAKAFKEIKGSASATAEYMSGSFGKFRELESKGQPQMNAKEKAWYDEYYKGMDKVAKKIREDLIPAQELLKQKLAEAKAMLEAGHLDQGTYDEYKKRLEYEYKTEPLIRLKELELQREQAITDQKKEQAKLSQQIAGVSTRGADAGLVAMAKQVADQFGIAYDIALALVKVESNWNPNAPGGSGEIGLTQLMPGTAAEMGVKNRYDPMQNLQGGFGYLAKMIKMFGDLDKALAAYNTGPGTVQKYGITAKGQEYLAKIKAAMGGASTQETQLQKTNELELANLEKTKAKLIEIRDLKMQGAKDAQDRAAIEMEYNNQIMDVDTEIAQKRREYGEESKQLVQDRLQMEVSALEQILESATLTYDQYNQVYKLYHDKRLALIEMEKQAKIKAGVDAGIAEQERAKKEEDMARQRQSKALQGASEIAQLAKEYAQLAGTQQQVYEAEMMMIAAKWREMEANTALDIPGLKEAYRQLYAEQMRIADVMAHGSFAEGFIEGLREIAREMKTIGELGKEVAKTIASAFGTFISDVITGQKKIKDAFRDMLDTIIKKLADLFAENLVQQIAKALTGGGKAGGGGGGIGGWLSGLIGGGKGGGGAGGGLAGILGGASGVATMNVTAGVVNIGGAGGMFGSASDLFPGGFGGGSGGGGGTCPLPGAGGGG